MRTFLTPLYAIYQFTLCAVQAAERHYQRNQAKYTSVSTGVANTIIEIVRQIVNMLRDAIN